MKGFFLDDESKILRIIDRVSEINESEGFIKFGNSGKLSGVNFSAINLVVTDDQREFKVGDLLPTDTVDKKAELIKQSSEELVNSLGMEITKLKFEIMNLKGGTTL